MDKMSKKRPSGSASQIHQPLTESTTMKSSDHAADKHCPPLQNHIPAARRRVYTPIGDAPSATRQEFKDDCDINKILAKYQKTGAINHFAKYAAEYGDYDPCDLQSAYAMIQRAKTMFDELPSAIRREVQSPEGFLRFVQDPANKARMQELGLTATPLPPTPAPSPAPSGAV